MAARASKGYYSLIQYCPDLGRLEAANVGVLLFCPEQNFLKAMTSTNNSRIIRFFGRDGHDWARINAFKKGIEDRIDIEGGRIRNCEELQRFIDQRANLLQITPPRSMRVIEPLRDLRSLAKEFLGRVPKGATRSMRVSLGESFSAAGLDRVIRRGIEVMVPVLQTKISVPYGFQNGRFNLITPAKFSAENPDQSAIAACRYAVEGKSLFETPDPHLGELQLVVVGRFRQGDLDSQTRVRRVLSSHSVKLVPEADLPQFIDHIKATGKAVDSAAS